jgi:hypothetical protein
MTTLRTSRRFFADSYNFANTAELSYGFKADGSNDTKLACGTAVKIPVGVGYPFGCGVLYIPVFY